MRLILFFLMLVASLRAQTFKDDGSLFVNEPSANKIENILSGCPATNNLFTFYAQNNAQRGIMFDLQAINAVTILCFDVNLAVGTTNVEIYTKAGTHVGFQNTPGAWTLVGTAVNVVSAGVNVGTYIPIAVNTPIGAGNTQAFYITRTTAGGPTVDYTNGVAVGNLLASDANLRIFDGTGKEYPFSTNFSPRQFNGRIYYNTGILPIEMTSFIVASENNSNILKWECATEMNNEYFSVEKSSDATIFNSIGKINGAGTSMVPTKYSFVDNNVSSATNYYRIKQVDFDGSYKNSSIVAIDNNKTIYRNVVKTFDPMGREITDISNFKGIYIIQYDNGTYERKNIQ